ncbi:MAG: aminopeptidase P family protein [Clostridiales bacterium]|nr:aminopeptidase P family protein [Clostridiales bacterium]
MKMYTEKLPLIYKTMQEDDIDVWMIVGGETETNTEPVLPILGEIEYIGATAIIFEKAGKARVFCTPIDVNGYKLSGHFDEVVAYQTTLADELARYAGEHRAARIALNYSMDNPACDGLTHGKYRYVTEAFAQGGFAGELLSAARLVGKVRGVKSPWEIERITEAARLAHEIMLTLSDVIRPGVPVKAVFDHCHAEMARRGLLPSWTASFCPGVHAGQAPRGHMAITDRRMARGEIVCVDFGVKYKGYSSDLQRSWYILREDETEPPAEVLHVFETVRDAIQLAARAAKPGMTGFEVDKVARDYITGRGYESWNAALGHQLGREAHDGGTILANDRPRYNRPELIHTPIDLGNVFTLEPSAACSAGSVGLEEDVVVEENGARFLIPPQTELYLIKA